MIALAYQAAASGQRFTATEPASFTRRMRAIEQMAELEARLMSAEKPTVSVDSESRQTVPVRS